MPYLLSFSINREWFIVSKTFCDPRKKLKLLECMFVFNICVSTTRASIVLCLLLNLYCFWKSNRNFVNKNILFYLVRS